MINGREVVLGRAPEPASTQEPATEPGAEGVPRRRRRARQIAAWLTVLLAAGLAVAAVMLFGDIGAPGGCGGG